MNNRWAARDAIRARSDRRRPVFQKIGAPPQWAVPGGSPGFPRRSGAIAAAVIIDFTVGFGLVSCPRDVVG